MSTSFEEIVQKTVNAEAKAGLKFNVMIQHSNAYCPRAYHFSHVTFSKILMQKTKESYLKESRAKKTKSANDIILHAAPH